MLRRLLAIIALALMPVAPVLALPDGSAVGAPPYTVTGSLLDQFSKTSASASQNKNQGLLGYNLSFHDKTYQYSLPLCDGALMVEVDGRSTDATTLAAGDTISVSVQANAKLAGKTCVNRIVREKLSRGASGGECLQNFQIKHAIAGEPSKLLIKTEYTYQLTAYARPTLDCDAKAYGASPITTVVAAAKPFVVTLVRDIAGGQKELMRWSLTTDNAGRASFTQTFNAPADNYHFVVIPGGNAVAGDSITWDAKVVDPNPSPSPVATAGSSNGTHLTTAPIIVVLVIILLGAAGAEYWRWVKKRRAQESPEQEYQRVQRL